MKWETDISINLGLDFGFWDNRLQGSIDLYSRTAKDLLDFEPLPSNNPVTSIAANIGSTRSKGIDFSLNSKNIVGHKFTWSSNITLSSYKVFWVERNPMVSLPEYIGKNDPLHAFYGWRTDGIILSSKDKPPYMPDAHRGNIKYIDLNKDGKLDIKDVTYLGNADPKATFGFGNTFAYSGFDLSFYFYGFIGYPLWNGYQYYASPNNLAGAQSINTDSQVRDAWATFNPAGTQPGIADDNYSGNNPAGTDFGMEDASFLRLKNIMLGYTLPSNIIKRIGINNLRFYLNVQNLWLFTKYKGIDPEMSAYYDPYPTTRGASFGVNVTF